MEYFQPIVARVPGHHPSPYVAPNTDIIKLNSNENPYPPSSQALKVLKTFNGEWLRRYPDPYTQEFCDAAAKVLEIPPNWIITGNGCDDLLNIIVRACVDRARSVVYPTPTYGQYRILAELCGSQLIEIPYGIQSSLPLEEMIQAKGALTLIASPNSPSGHQVPLTELRQLADNVSGVLVVDEAYVDFTDASALSLVRDYEHMVILRTLSKGYSLAGLRFGFGIAQPPLLAGLFKVKDSYGVDAIATRVAAAAITDQLYKDQCVSQIKRDRQRLTLALQRLGFQVSPSHGNFVLASHPNARPIHDDLKSNNIWVRYYAQLSDKLRITIGTPEQNCQLLEVVSRLLR
ncbi:MAG: histidinol-phosphate transaminase [Leptolyngbyaceae cyanobacterium]